MSAATTVLTETVPGPGTSGSKQDLPSVLLNNRAEHNKASSHSDLRTGSNSLINQTGKLVTDDRVDHGSGGGGGPGVDAVTPAMRRREKVVLAAMCLALFLAGWCDGTTGPLLPRIQHVYGVGFAVVSIIFISTCLGFIFGALTNVFLTERYNFGSLMISGSVFQVIGCAIQASAPPFPLLCVAYALNGFGGAIQDAQANGLVASLHEHASEKMGLIHAIYGLGAFASPLVSTQFAQLPRWSFHFLVSLSIAVINTVVLVGTIRTRSLETVLRSVGSPPAESHTTAPSGDTSNVEMSSFPNETTPARRSAELNGQAERGSSASSATMNKQGSLMSQIMRNVTVQLIAVFILVYVGVEVTIGGWIVTYLINVRGGGPSSGYASSGFFGGLTVGRVALLWINKVVGERRVVFIYAALAIGFELVVWLVPSLVGNAVAVSIIGVLLGPMYPLAMNHAGRVLPRKILTGSIGWIAGFGQAGSAVIPFMTGALASRFGIKSLQPLLVAMMGLMTVLWAVIPNHSKRRD